MLIALVNSFRTSQPFGKNLVISENSTSEVEKEMAFTLNEADCGHWEHHFKYTSTHNLYTLYKLAELIQSRHKILQSALRLGPKWMKLAFHNMLFPKFFHFSWESSVQKVLCFSIHDEDHPDHCQSCPLNITESAWCIIASVQPGLPAHLPPLPQPVALRLFLGVAAPHLHLLLLLLLLLLQHESIALNYVSNIRWIVFLNHHVRKHGSNAWNYLFSHNFSESPINYHIKRTKTLVEAYARCITENITKRWLRQTLVVERGIAVSYKYNPLASVPVPEICVPVLCSRAQKVAVIVIKRKCRLIPDLPAPVARLFVRWGSAAFMTN